jgi:hypothetical protein
VDPDEQESRIRDDKTRMTLCMGLIMEGCFS